MTDDSYSRLLSACREIILDPMAYVASWKTRTPNGRAVGFFPTGVPMEIIHAVGGLPVGVWGGDNSAGSANARIQQFTCSIVRSATEYALDGTLDVLDAMLFPPICDSAKLVASIWSFNLAHKFMVEMVNLPERVDSDASVDYTAAELRRVHAVLAHLFGVTVSAQALRDAMVAVNRLRQAQQAFCAWRAAAGSGVTLADACTVLRAGTIMHVDEYVPLLEALLAHGAEDSRDRLPRTPVVVSGLACQLPHADFFASFENAGLRVVEDDLFLGVRGAHITESGDDPYRDIARAFVSAVPMATRHNGRMQRHEALLESVRSGGAKGVVFLVPKFCEPEWFDVRYLQAETRKASIPSIVIDFEEGPGMTGGVQTRLEAFAESLA